MVVHKKKSRDGDHLVEPAAREEEARARREELDEESIDRSPEGESRL